MSLKAGTVLACLTWAGCVGLFAESAPAAIVTIPVYRLLDLGFTTHWKADKDDKITRVVVVDVRQDSPAWKHGLRKYFELTAIDHRPLEGMKQSEYLALEAMEPEVDHPKTFTFTRIRPFIPMRYWSFDLVVSLIPKARTVPSQSSGPTHASVTPPAGQESRPR